MGQRPLLYQKAGSISKAYQTPRGLASLSRPPAPRTTQFESRPHPHIHCLRWPTWGWFAATHSGASRFCLCSASPAAFRSDASVVSPAADRTLIRNTRIHCVPSLPLFLSGYIPTTAHGTVCAPPLSLLRLRTAGGSAGAGGVSPTRPPPPSLPPLPLESLG